MTQPPTDPESSPPPEQPVEPVPEALPAAPRRAARPPIWPYFLTPIAVLAGAAAIVVTIILLDDEPPPAEPIGPALEAMAEAVDSLATAVDDLEAAPQPAAPAEPVTLRGTLEGYAAALELDVEGFAECLSDTSKLQVVGDQLQRGLDLGVNGTPSFFVNNKYISGAQPSVVFAEVIAAELAGSPTSLDEYSETIQVLASREPPAFAILDRAPDFTNAAIKGSPDAAVVIVEFSDFQCPFCRRWYDDTFPEIDRQIGDDVALVFLHFPIMQLHPNAPTVHVAAECAGEQGKFWEMHDLLFERQDEWSRLPNPN